MTELVPVPRGVSVEGRAEEEQAILSPKFRDRRYVFNLVVGLDQAILASVRRVKLRFYLC